MKQAERPGGGGRSVAALLAKPAAALVCLISVACLVWGGLQLWASFTMKSRSPESLVQASAVASDNWRYRATQAEQALILNQPQRAEQLFREAIDRFGACARCWLGVAEARWRQGLSFEDELVRARELGRADTRVRSMAAVFLARLGRREEALDDFLDTLGGVRGERAEMFSVLERSYDFSEILQALQQKRSDLLIDYWDYVLAEERKVSETMIAKVWAALPESDLDAGVRGRYADYLLRLGRYGEAWRALFDEDPPVDEVASADFESIGKAGRFDWRLQRGEGVRASIERCLDCRNGGRALRLVFDGRHNADYSGVTVFVPLKSGADYELVFKASYEDLTSASGPLVAIVGQGADKACQFRAESQQFRLSEAWHEVRVPFAVPMACEGARITVLRRRTDRPNGHISGDLWLDDFELRFASGADLGAELLPQ